ncbi:hypothetical protein T12_15217 [Trichinella patagoniensis]|uniref:Uncharacterized protein n=1 Tax=Trichinella patagoniensis TaxID=990121 RepID=A0A0V0Z976_9BILA|nr:hypothetical protein T12_15217 [Trichinella patagoniensis]
MCSAFQAARIWHLAEIIRIGQLDDFVISRICNGGVQIQTQRCTSDFHPCPNRRRSGQGTKSGQKDSSLVTLSRDQPATLVFEPLKYDVAINGERFPPGLLFHCFFCFPELWKNFTTGFLHSHQQRSGLFSHYHGCQYNWNPTDLDCKATRQSRFQVWPNHQNDCGLQAIPTYLGKCSYSASVRSINRYQQLIVAHVQRLAVARFFCLSEKPNQPLHSGP